MSSPNPPHTIKVEAFLGGAWTDLTADVYQRSAQSITSGATSEQGVIQPTVLTNLVLGNNALAYSTGNALSPYYGQFVKGAEIRESVAGTNYRFHGQITSIRPRHDLSQNDKYVEIEAGSVLRRLGQGTSLATSGPRRWIPTTSPTAYWPLEDGPLAVQGVALVGPYNLLHLGTLKQNWGAGTLAPWLPLSLQGLMNTSQATQDAYFTAPVTPQGASAGWAIDYYINGFPDYSISVNHAPTLGTTNGWTLSMTPSTSNILVTPPAGSAGGGSFTYLFDGQFHWVRFQAVKNFVGDATYFVIIDGVTITSGHVTAAAPNPVQDVVAVQITLADGQPGSVKSTRATIGHAAFYANTATPPSSTTAVAVAFGRVGEASGDRITRLCSENSIALDTIGTLTSTPPMGPQGLLTLKALLQECADAAGGMLFESKPNLALAYRTRDATYQQAVALTLDYAALNNVAAPLAPPDDDQLLRNYWAVTRTLGGTEIVQQTTGPYAVATIGKYDSSVTLNVLSQAQARDQAGFRVLIGTYGGARFPSVLLNMSILSLAQRTNVLALLLGSRIQVLNPPHDIGFNTLDLLVVGMKETLNTFDWFIELVCTPYAPYLVFVADDAVYSRPSSDGSTVTCTAGATSWSVATPSGPLWTTAAADFPFDIGVEGERVTVTNITGAASPQTFTVTRAINGVVKAHTAAAVDLWFPLIVAM